MRIRPATSADDAVTEAIEIAADGLLINRFSASSWPPPASSDERRRHCGFLLVAEVDDRVVLGFVHVLEVDGHAHLEQVSVRPSHARAGIGRQLVNAAMSEAHRRGYRHMTLRTYADVPWNAPFYASCGFSETEPDSPFLGSLVEIERTLGLLEYGRRIQMTAAI